MGRGKYNFDHVPVNPNRPYATPLRDGIDSMIRIGWNGTAEDAKECDGHEPKPNELRTTYRYADGKTQRFNPCKVCGRLIEKQVEN